MTLGTDMTGVSAAEVLADAEVEYSHLWGVDSTRHPAHPPFLVEALRRVVNPDYDGTSPPPVVVILEDGTLAKVEEQVITVPYDAHMSRRFAPITPESTT